MSDYGIPQVEVPDVQLPEMNFDLLNYEVSDPSFGRPLRPDGKPVKRRSSLRIPNPQRFQAEESAPLWQRAIDFILRPARAVRGAVYHAMRSGETDPAAAALQGFWRGLKGDEKIDFVDILKRAGMDRGWLRSALGFAGDIVIDPAAHTATLDGCRLDLPPREFDLLHTLALEAGRVISTDELLSRVWGAEYAGEPQVVYVHVRWLREKLEANPSRPTRIVTIRGVGYKLEPQEA